MTAPQFIAANLQEHRAELLALNIEYVSWVFSQIDATFSVSCAAIVGMEAPAYAESMLEKMCNRTPPHGSFYLIRHHNQTAGMGGLRALGSDVAEIKRVYVRPVFRGARLGEHLLQRLLADAAQFGFKRVVLESAPFMKGAHRIYGAAGFRNRVPYSEAEVPALFQDRWCFMERSLASPHSA